MVATAESRSSAQRRKPTPMGRCGVGVGVGVALRVDEDIRDDACSRSAAMSGLALFMKPRPPARDTATARAGPDMTRMGALTISGLDVHG